MASESTFSNLIAGARAVLRRVSGDSNPDPSTDVQPSSTSTSSSSSRAADADLTAPTSSSSPSSAPELRKGSRHRRKPARLTEPRKRTKTTTGAPKAATGPAIVDASVNRPGDVCELEEIRGCKVNPLTGRPVAYLCKWVGQDDEESTWELVADLVNAQEAIDTFLSCKNQWRWQYWAYVSQNGKPVGWLDMDSSLWPGLSRDYAEWCNNNGETPISIFRVRPDGKPAPGPEIQTGRYKYQLDFNGMTQLNKDPRYLTPKYIRAVPILPIAGGAASSASALMTAPRASAAAAF